MTYVFEQGKDVIIQAVIDKVHQKMPAHEAESCAEFIRQFFRTVAYEDLSVWAVEDLYGASVNFWALLHERQENETKIRIYNPDFEKHGWQSTHTVIEVLSKDMPFIVDSLKIVVNRMGLACHLSIHTGGIALQRNEQGVLTHVIPREKAAKAKHVIVEAPVLLQIDRQTDQAVLEELYEQIERTMEDNRAVVSDWQAMRNKVNEAIADLDKMSAFLDAEELSETKAFLRWMEDDHFTFLGVRDYELSEKNGETVLSPIVDSGLGVLRPQLSASKDRRISTVTPEGRANIFAPQVLVMTKTHNKATVHRAADPDYIGIKRYNDKGQVIGERRIIGLYTSSAYNVSPRAIPILRRKINTVLEHSNLNPKSHAGKVLLNLLETLPRDDIIQASEKELLDIAMGVYYMQDRPRIRLFARTDVYRRFVSCLVYVPKERLNTELRNTIQTILAESFGSSDIEFSSWYPESALARVHYIVRLPTHSEANWDFKEIEQRIVEVSRSWADELQHYLGEAYGEEQGNVLFNKYKTAFPTAYRDQYSPRAAVYDIKHLESIHPAQPLVIHFYRPMDESNHSFRLKIYQQNHTIPLSDVLPIIENLGMRAISERPYRVTSSAKEEAWISDFSLQYVGEKEFDIDDIKELFQQAFESVWFGMAENDAFNRLVLAASLDWRQVAGLRAYAKYFKQIRFTFSPEYIEQALYNNAEITKKLAALFALRFDPALTKEDDTDVNNLANDIISALDDVSNLDEDKILRQYVYAIMSTLRTNFYQLDAQAKHKSYISLKLNPRTMPGVPKPHPLFEIFVYSPRFEGVHLRGSKVARGGLRWSDRPEDFRTEVLGLVKAQQVKNAVIVPSGAKGGFVPKRIPATATRDEAFTEGVACYQLFIRGLLDITDNYQGGAVVKPTLVRCYDEDDPYLVVAADKGTATFSDIANAISQEYQFWLGDAFASGGSVGYDHKKMGITAKGAWESVKRHFFEIGINDQKDDFSVIGIGDMAGDVFGNGMLLSQHIKLLGAFNHVHIFVDPNPEPKKAFAERERLFNLPRSSWMDYDAKLISKGGGVFNRSAKSIPVSPEMRKIFGIQATQIEPNELIKTMLTSQVDLIWSGGIGTFVKSTDEAHTDVGDRANDNIRVNGCELRARVVGEGGNLGCTQLGRIEYEQNGGLIFTDFIDNSGGVNCSDKEVNIKILLNHVVESGDLTLKQRNQLLSDMTDEVGQLVLKDNFTQPRAISFAVSQTQRQLEIYARFIQDMERIGKLDRAIEFLPDEKMLAERKLSGKGLARPELAVLLCYSKNYLKEQILASRVPEDEYLLHYLVAYFPKPLQERFTAVMPSHPLRREIIATTISNLIVNEMGAVFVYRMVDETGASIESVVRAYLITRAVFGMQEIWKQISAIEGLVSVDKQHEMTMLFVRLVRRVTRWLLRQKRGSLPIQATIDAFAPGLETLKAELPKAFAEKQQQSFAAYLEESAKLGVPTELARQLALSRAMFPAMDIIELSRSSGLSVADVAHIYFKVGEILDLSWFRSQVIAHATDNNWESLSREALRDDLDWQQQKLALGIIKLSEREQSQDKAFASWQKSQERLMKRWYHVISELRSLSALNYTMYFVATRELMDLTQSTLQLLDE